MTYTEKELDQFLHGISLSLLSKKSAQHWRYDEETAREIEWLEALERKVRADKADRKTEPTSSKMEQVEDEPQTDTHDICTETHECVKDTHDRIETMSCQECKWWSTDSLKHGGYCQSLLYNHECRYEPLSE